MEIEVFHSLDQIEVFHSLDQTLLDAFNVTYWPRRRRHVHHRRESSGNMYLVLSRMPEVFYCYKCQVSCLSQLYTYLSTLNLSMV